MSNEPDMSSPANVENLVNRWRQARKEGRTISAEELCADCPEALPALRKALEAPRPGASPRTLLAPADEKSNAPTLPQAVVAPTVRVSPVLPRLPGYEIFGKLGEGGMGVVYKARQLGLNRIVAVKMIRAGGLVTDEQVARFLTEAEAVARIEHPNIVHIYEIGEHEGCPYFSLEFCGGGTLARRAQASPLGPREAAGVVEVLARAIHVAHQKGIVHRDLKPGNVLLGEDGTPKITDFGLAKKLDEAGHTRAGQVVGTPNYMAPEQAQGRLEDIGPATDVYALGAILYELLTARPPFHSESTIETMISVVREDPVPPTRLEARVHRDLETICLCCLRKEPGKRYTSALELADDLKRFLNGEPIHARPATRLERTWHWCRRRPTVTALLLVAVLAALVLVPVEVVHQYRLADAQARAEAAQKEKDAAEHLARLAHEAEEAAKENAATQEYFSLFNRARERISRGMPGWTWTGLEDLEKAARLPTKARSLRELRTEAARCVAGVELEKGNPLVKDFPAYALAFSPDGKWLLVGEEKAAAYVLPCRVLRVDAETGAVERRLAFASHLVPKGGGAVQDGVRSLACSRDGKRVAAGARSGWVHLWDLQNPDPKAVSWKGDERAIEHLCFSRDGSRLIAGSRKTVKSWDVAAPGKETAKFEPRTEVEALTFCPEGAVLACSCEDAVTLLDPEKLTRAAALPFSPNAFCFSPDGQVVAGEQERKLVLIDRASGKKIRSLPDLEMGAAHEGPVHALAFTADGSLLLSACNREEDRKVKVWEVASGRLLATRVLPSGGRLSMAVSRHAVALGAERQVVRYHVTGMTERTFLAHHPHPVGAMSFTPDGGLACVAGIERGDGNGGRTVSVWGLNGQRTKSHSFPLSGGCPPLIAVHPRGEGVACSGWSAGVDLWPFSGRPGRTIPAKELCALAFDHSGKALWGIVNANTVQSWSWPEGEPRTHWTNVGAEAVSGLGGLYCLTAGERWVVAGGRDGRTRLLRVADGQREKNWWGGGGPVRSVALRQDGALAASGHQHGEVLLARVPAGEVVGKLEDHEDSVEAVAFTRDGQWLATGGRDRRVHLYRREGEDYQLWTTLHLPAPVAALSFHPDREVLAVLVQHETAVRLWHLDRLHERFDRLHLAEESPPR